MKAGMWGYLKQTSRTKRCCSETRNVNDWSESFLKSIFLGIAFRAYLKFAERQRSKFGRSAEGTKPDTNCRRRFKH